jgi:hypothetical protein
MPRIIGASVYSENFQGGDITDDEWAFLKAIEAYQRRWRRRYPSWREVLYVLHCLGYRKVAEPTPADANPVTVKERKLAEAVLRAARRDAESASPQLPA